MILIPLLKLYVKFRFSLQQNIAKNNFCNIGLFDSKIAFNFKYIPFKHLDKSKMKKQEVTLRNIEGFY